MVLSLKYAELSGAVTESNRLANELGQYCDELSRRVQQKMYSVEDGMSSALNSADYYVGQKLRQIRAREANARDLSGRLQTLLDTAKRVDADVERTIQANQNALFQKNPELEAPWYKQAWTSFICDLKNVPVIGWLIKGREQVISALDTLWKEIRFWYRCEGGKELVGIIISAAGAVLSVVALVCAVVFTGGTVLAVISGVAAFIGSLIGAVNAVTNLVTSFRAYHEAIGGHPGRAKIYAGQDTLSDVLRQTNFHNRDWNRGSNAWAAGIEITDAICSIITIVKGAVDSFDALRKINIKRTFQAICQPRDARGRFVQGKPTLWNGLKCISMKFNLKDFILGDMNYKNLTRIIKLPTADRFKTIGGLAKAIKGFTDDLGRMNQGSLSWNEFLAKRTFEGLDSTFLKRQVLNTRIDDNGVRVRKFRDTNFTKIIGAFRQPIDGLGLGKLLTDIDRSGGLSDVFGMKGGLIGNVADIIKQLKTFDGLMVTVKKPAIDTYIEPAKPGYVMPPLNFVRKFEVVCPYFNVSAA